MNLLEETLSDLKDNGVSENEILWVGNDKYYFEWAEFKELANSTNYDCGYGAQEIAKDILLVGENFYFERAEYDGSEWWEFKKIQSKPLVKKIPKKLNVDLWVNLYD